MKLELTTHSFEKYLEEKCFAANTTVLDDDMPDFFDNWLSEQDCITLKAYASLYAHQQGKLLAESYIKEQGYEHS